jgi:hypothetical protein
MTSTTTERDLLKLEKRFWQAMKDHDVESAVALTDFPCIVSGPQGIARVEEYAFRTMMSSQKYSIDDFEFEDAQVRMIGRDVAVVAYKVHEHMTVDGKPVSLDAADSSTWVRRDGRWVCALHSESIIGDPFGGRQKQQRDTLPDTQRGQGVRDDLDRR